MNFASTCYAKMPPADYANCRREFSQYGYDPYNSVNDVEVWARVEHLKTAPEHPLYGS